MGIQINGNTNNINAGIGSLSIEDINELDIAGVATASNFKTGSSNLHSTGLTVGNNFLHSTGINVGTGATIHVPASNVLTLGTNNSERLRINSSGDVKVTSGYLEVQGGGLAFLTNSSTIQTGSSSYMLGIQGGATNMGGRIELRGGSDTGDIRMFAQGATSTQAERLRIDSIGRVMIGTTTAGESSADELTVANSGHAGMTIRSGTSSWGSFFFSDGTSGGAQYDGAIEYKHSDNYMRFRTAQTERFRIGSSGQLGIAGANYGSSGQVLTSQGSGSAPQWATPSSGGVTVSGNSNNRITTGDGTNLVAEPHLQFNPDSSGDGILSVTAPEGGDSRIQLNADENDDLFDRWELQSAADNHFYVNQMSAGGAYTPYLKFHSERGNMEPIYDPLGLHGGGVVIAMANTNSGNQSDSPNFKVDFTVPSADINTIKRNGARQGFNFGAGNETGSYISPHGASGILIASCFGNYYWGFATKIYHISIYGSYGNNNNRAVSLNQLHSYSGAGHGASNAHISLSVQSIPNNQKYTPKLRATFGGDYWSSNFLVVTYVGSGVASYANLRSLSHINSEITGQDTAWK